MAGTACRGLPFGPGGFKNGPERARSLGAAARNGTAP